MRNNDTLVALRLPKNLNSVLRTMGRQIGMSKSTLIRVMLVKGLSEADKIKPWVDSRLGKSKGMDLFKYFGYDLKKVKT
jgi:hypothetical protein